MKMLRIVIVCILVVGLLALASFAEEKTYTLRFNTVGKPPQPSTHALDTFANLVEKLSTGKIKVKIFHSGQLGDQKTSILSVMRGDLDMTFGGASWFASLVPHPKVGVFTAAYAFRDLDHMYKIMTGPIGKEYWDDIREKAGIRVLDVWYNGTRELNVIKKVGPVHTPEDMKGVKLRMPNVPLYLDMGRILGAEPTPLGYGEIYLGLKTGLIEGQDNPLPNDDALKVYEVTHYMVLTDHLIGHLCPIINEALWQSMPEEYRVYIKKALIAARYHCNYLVLKQEAELLGKFKEHGMEIVIPNKEAFMERAVEIYKKYEDEWGGMYEKIQNMR